MMKKTLLALVAAALVISMTACSGNTDAEKDGENDKDPITDNSGENGDGNGETNAEDENGTGDENDADNENNAEDENGDGETSTQTIAESFAAIFQENAADAESAKALADTLIEKSELPITLVSAEVAEGTLSGFGSTEITGFSEGAVFSPMIGSIPFISYVFVLPEDADIEEFTTLLSDNADLRWNICVTADEMKIDTKDNKVFFIMCPTNFEE